MPALARTLEPEILDSLDPTDSRAVRSRRDLAWIDRWMGNSRWIAKTVSRSPDSARRIVELGAGTGGLCQKLHSMLPRSQVAGMDLAPRPPSLPEGVQWITGDIFQTLAPHHGGCCVGSLVLHHFSDTALRVLGARLADFSELLFVEPLRSRVALAASRLVSPLAGEVTRHDMPASIRAGFVPGELMRTLGLHPEKWISLEDRGCPWRGWVRFHAIQR